MRMKIKIEDEYGQYGKFTVGNYREFEKIVDDIRLKNFGKKKR